MFILTEAGIVIGRFETAEAAQEEVKNTWGQGEDLLWRYIIPTELHYEQFKITEVLNHPCDIPEDQIDNFPEGISEYSCQTFAEMRAFLTGLKYVQAHDVCYGEVFQRNGQFVVRIKVED